MILATSLELSVSLSNNHAHLFPVSAAVGVAKDTMKHLRLIWRSLDCFHIGAIYRHANMCGISSASFAT